MKTEQEIKEKIEYYKKMIEVNKQISENVGKLSIPACDRWIEKYSNNIQILQWVLSN